MKKIYKYIIGFGLSIFLTFLAFGLVGEHVQTGHLFPSHTVLIPVLIGLAIAQLLVQLVFFLHLGQESKPRWNLVAFCFALLIVIILVGGTLWIMRNLAQGHAEGAYNVFMEENIEPHTE